jgi:hypothetical protein
MVFSRLVVVLFVGLFLARPAFAYLDPNASSVLLQVILGGVAGVAIAARLLWSRILGLFRRRKVTEAGNGRGEQ